MKAIRIVAALALSSVLAVTSYSECAYSASYRFLCEIGEQLKSLDELATQRFYPMLQVEENAYRRRAPIMSTKGNALGVFESHGDIGSVKHNGDVSYDGQTQCFHLSGSGTNMWSDQDEFHFLWKKLTGDFILTTNVTFLGEGVDPHRKLGWMIRSDLDSDSAYVDVALHGDGLTSMQYRRSQGAETEQIESAVKNPAVLQLERRDGKYVMSVARRGEAFVSEELTDLNLPEEVYVGLFVCAHNPEVVESADFHNVRITLPAQKDFRPYQDYIGSRLETMNVDTGERHVQHVDSGAIQAPNWTKTGNALICNRDGRLFRFDLGSKKLTEIDTAFANRNNNDHALSFDGATLGISHHSADHNGDSMVYTVPIMGGRPQLITTQGPSYFHGWSPDGQWLTYTGGRNGNFDIYKIRSDGSGAEIRLTTNDSLDDGSEFAPDGQFIYFNSSRSGRMQIWRMKPDGTAQEQVTDDEYNNWFPHLAPDGKRLVMLSYSSDIAADDHPWYKPVTLRMMPTAGGKPIVIAYLYGGQGTINVPSWSPDSRSIAFVSNSRLPGEVP
ncbi:TolB family protein [Bythopirellula goksoeyrii]|uniref:Translocation protein TolB n=1 Tax=Bythopirellula goksoeyrii TaxID=1400387 RepID=A0A5B9QIL8_9BACT|nr:TolB family protein [Bythopirellula goksoeyrii]QEG33983.1 translocation protein TolB [Bythopirellula goksoeyrii]